MERTFPLHTPRVAQIEVVRYGKVRRAKLYYLRALHGKSSSYQKKSEDKHGKLPWKSEICEKSLYIKGFFFSLSQF